MNYVNLKKLIATIGEFTAGTKTALDLADAAGEKFETLMRVLTETSLADTQGNPTPNTEPWHVLAALLFLYMGRCDYILHGSILEAANWKQKSQTNGKRTG